jgi:hypothetical protein
VDATLQELIPGAFVTGNAFYQFRDRKVLVNSLSTAAKEAKKPEFYV